MPRTGGSRSFGIGSRRRLSHGHDAARNTTSMMSAVANALHAVRRESAPSPGRRVPPQIAL